MQLDQAQSKFDSAVDHFKKNLSTIRAGAANPKLVEDIKVEAYGQTMPLNQLANISATDPTLIVVQPWDKSVIEDIQKALLKNDIGITPAIDGDIIRLPLPQPTQERRQEYVKLMKKRMEEARIVVRQIRKEVLDSLEAGKEEGNITEDELELKSKQLQEMVDKTNDEIERLGKEKEEELMKV